MNQLAHINAQPSTDNGQQGAGQTSAQTTQFSNDQPSTYRTLVDLKAQQLIVSGVRPLKEIESEVFLMLIARNDANCRQPGRMAA